MEINVKIIGGKQLNVCTEFGAADRQTRKKKRKKFYLSLTLVDGCGKRKKMDLTGVQEQALSKNLEPSRNS